ncbi:hypothetical protein ROLI_025380 [Roseobacter fucihabitans]|uniref:Uncharacterized protein n=1 Tax=Roseobacter fucihabitans TaxID=1537242 RepID=A0ABZ2BTV5_9RHOB|nr:hypothetical protein [Roseobacter litoralis]MBC6967634.1 hypothetical protein [Roseobacter litoralis]
MSKPVSNGDTDPPDRRLRGNKSGGPEKPAKMSAERLVLSPQLRVQNSDILRLESRHAVSPADNPGEATGAQKRLPDHDGDVGSKKTAADFGIDELTAKITALETAIAKTSDQWEPDGSSRDAYSGTPSAMMSWQESIELDATGTPVTADTALQVQVPDEGALRQLVAEVVRRELEGAAGEQITRNLRIMVRQEIQRALAARDAQ